MSEATSGDADPRADDEMPSGGEPPSAAPGHASAPAGADDPRGRDVPLAAPPGFRCGLFALAGRPNVGKSTLVNALCGAHVAIVSDKPQTTRRRIAGVANGDGHQLVLLDLPGFQRPRDTLTERMQRTVDESIADVDAVILVLDATTPPGPGDRFIAERVFALGVPVLIALNKVDLLAPPAIARAIERAARLGPFAELHPISARTSGGVEALRADLVRLSPEGPPLYAPDAESSDPLRLRIGELVREQALLLTREEVPHAVAVSVDEVIRPTRRRPGRVEASILVETESQKGILVGRAGAMIRAIGTGARPEIERLLGGQVMLDLRVRVRRGWRDDDRLLDELLLDLSGAFAVGEGGPALSRRGALPGAEPG